MVVVALSFLVRGSAGGLQDVCGRGPRRKGAPQCGGDCPLYLVSQHSISDLRHNCSGYSRQMRRDVLGKFLFHGACVFMAAFDTGGFAPQSQNILYYHSLAYEIVTIIIMILGSLNFKLHYTLWMRSKKEIVTNIETRTFL